MKEKIYAHIRKARSLAQVNAQFLDLCRILRDDEHADRIGYVAGVLFSEGADHVEQNIKKLNSYTELLRMKNPFPIFSSVDIFYDEEFYKNLAEANLPYQERRTAFFQFYRDMLSSGYITDIFMTPRWEISEGATDEHETAKKQNLTIWYVPQDSSI